MQLKPCVIPATEITVIKWCYLNCTVKILFLSTMLTDVLRRILKSQWLIKKKRKKKKEEILLFCPLDQPVPRFYKPERYLCRFPLRVTDTYFKLWPLCFILPQRWARSAQAWHLRGHVTTPASAPGAARSPTAEPCTLSGSLPQQTL